MAFIPPPPPNKPVSDPTVVRISVSVNSITSASQHDLDYFKQSIKDDNDHANSHERKAEERKKDDRHHAAVIKKMIHDGEIATTETQEVAESEAVESDINESETKAKQAALASTSELESEPDLESTSETTEAGELAEEGAAAKEHTPSPSKSFTGSATNAGVSAQTSQASAHPEPEAVSPEAPENLPSNAGQAANPKPGSSATPRTALEKSGIDGAPENSETAQSEAKPENSTQSKGGSANPANAFKGIRTGTPHNWISLSSIHSNAAKQSDKAATAPAASESAEMNETSEELGGATESKSGQAPNSKNGLPGTGSAKIISGESMTFAEPGPGEAPTAQAEGPLLAASMPAAAKAPATAAAPASATLEGSPSAGQENAPATAKAGVQTQAAGIPASAPNLRSATPGGGAASDTALESGSAGIPSEAVEGKAAQATQGNSQGTPAASGNPNQAAAKTPGVLEPGQGEAYDYAGQAAQEPPGAAKAMKGPQAAPPSGGAPVQAGTSTQAGAPAQTSSEAHAGTASVPGNPNQTAAKTPGAVEPGQGEAYDYAGQPPQESPGAAKASKGAQAAQASGSAPTQSGAQTQSGAPAPAGSEAHAGTASAPGNPNQAAAKTQGTVEQGPGETYDYAGQPPQESPGSAKASKGAQAAPPSGGASTQSGAPAQTGAQAEAGSEAPAGVASTPGNPNQSAAKSPPSTVEQGQGEAYDYAGQPPQESSGATAQNNASSNRAPVDQAANQAAPLPKQAAAMQDPQAASVGNAASNPSEPVDPRIQQTLQANLMKTNPNSQNPVLRSNDPNVIVESENPEARETASNPAFLDKGNASSKISETTQSAAVANTNMVKPPQGNPSDSEGSALARDVMDMVGRLLISANPWAPIQEIRLVLNSEVVPNTEIQMRMASGSVDVNIISDNNESLALLGRAGAGLTKTLENTTPGVVRVQLFNGNMESVRMDTGDYHGYLPDAQPQVEEPRIQGAPVVEAYDYRGQHHLQAKQSQPGINPVVPKATMEAPLHPEPSVTDLPDELPQLTQILQPTKGVENPFLPESDLPESKPASSTSIEMAELDRHDSEVPKIPVKATGSKPALTAVAKTDKAQGAGASELSRQIPSETNPSSEDASLFNDISQLVGRMLVSADPWAPVQDIRLILNNDVVPGTEIQMRMEAGRVNVDIISDNDESLAILGKAGGDLFSALESGTTGLVRVQMFNGSGERVEMGSPAISGTHESDTEGLKEDQGIFATEAMPSSLGPESALDLPPADELMAMVGRLLESAEPWSPLREIRIAVNGNIFPDTEIHMRRETEYVDLNIISGNNESLELLELAAADIARPMEIENRGPVRIRVTSSVEEDLP